MMKFKPNIYPVMYWGLMFGLIAGFILFAIFLLSQYITTIWFPVFLAGVVWGGYRNYRKQKTAWQESAGQPSEVASAVEEVKEAARDIVSATRDMMAEQPEATVGPEAPPAPEKPQETESDQSRNNLPPV